jgi:hypothetical protein
MIHPYFCVPIAGGLWLLLAGYRLSEDVMTFLNRGTLAILETATAGTMLIVGFLILILSASPWRLPWGLATIPVVLLELRLTPFIV